MSLMLGETAVPVYDLQIQPAFNDLIVGTHGRGFLILDDITPLEGLARASIEDAALFAPMTAWRYQFRPGTEHGRGAFVAPNKSVGALLSFYAAGPIGRREVARFEIRDLHGALVRRLEAGVRSGVNRMVWDLRADPLGGAAIEQDTRSNYVFYPMRIVGPRVPPGDYSVSMTLNGRSFEAPLHVRLDPRSRTSAAGMEAQAQAIERINQQQERGEMLLHQIDGLAQQISVVQKRSALGADVRRDLVAFGGDLRSLAELLRNPDRSGYRDAARAVEQLAYLRYEIDQYDGPPTVAQSEAIETFTRAVDDAASRAKDLFGGRLSQLNAELRSAGVPALSG